MSISYHRKSIKASSIREDTPARVIIAGGVATVIASSQGGQAPATVRIAGGLYVRRDTGEVIDPASEGCDGAASRARSLSESMARLRDVINSGCKPGSVWATHTYRACVRDTRAVYDDWEAYIRWARRYTARRIEYISAIEPQARGAWHIHGILIPGADDPRPIYIPQGEALAAWRRIAAKRMPEGDTRTSGGVHLHRIEDGGDNLGAYLSAYLTDTCGKKGGRLSLYPPGVRFYRVSRGVERPREIAGLTLAEARALAEEATGGAPAAYQAAYAVEDSLGRCVAFGYREQYKKK